MAELVSYRLEGPVATIAMDDGKMNVLSPDMLAQLNAALDRARADRAVVLLTGRPGVFSAGFDLGVFRAGGAVAEKMFIDGFKLAARLLAFPAPTILACSGHAIAMGSFLLLSADYRIGSAGQHKIGANEVAIGITMPFFGVEICRQRLTPACFNRAVINAEIFTPEDAVLAGFLDRVVPAAELATEAQATVAGLAKLDKDVHTATKLRARDQALKAVHAAIAADAALFQERG
jgi:enoyl-CoA hydratase